MESNDESGKSFQTADATATSIFDEVKPLPLYYSEKAIFGFAVFDGVLFASVLMAINFKNTPGKRGIWQVLIFGLLFTVVQITILTGMPKVNSGLSMVLNIAGGATLRYLFWPKYIGAQVQYVSKTIITPLIITITFIALIVIAVVFTSFA